MQLPRTGLKFFFDTARMQETNNFIKRPTSVPLNIVVTEQVRKIIN